MQKRIFLLTVDGLGLDPIPGAPYSDFNNLKSIYSTEKINIPFLRTIGLFNIRGVDFGRRSCIVYAGFGMCGSETSAGGSSVFDDDAMQSVAEKIRDAGMSVITVGDTFDGPAGAAVTSHYDAASCKEAFDRFIKLVKSDFNGFCTASLCCAELLPDDKRDPVGLCSTVCYFDRRMHKISHILRKEDIVIILVRPGSCRSLPVMIYGSKIKKAVDLGTGITYRDIAATISEYLDIPPDSGNSFIPSVIINSENLERSLNEAN